MGVRFTHTDAHWSYTGFARFRSALAAFEGIDLDRMEGFKPYGASDGWTGRPWSAVDAALKPLLDHSDCDGELAPDECRQIATRLRAVIDELWPADTATFAIDPEAHFNRSNGLLLADGMEAAAAADEPLEFC